MHPLPPDEFDEAIHLKARAALAAAPQSRVIACGSIRYRESNCAEPDAQMGQSRYI
jgi:hypothetical protein